MWPQLQRSRHGIVDLGAARYRQLWLAGWKAIAKYDPPSRNKVLFGETAAISSPMDTLYAALCLDERASHSRAGCALCRVAAARSRGCRSPAWRCTPTTTTRSARSSRAATPRTRCRWATSRAPTRCSTARRAVGRIPGGRGIYVTEFGFQSARRNPFGDALVAGPPGGGDQRGRPALLRRQARELGRPVRAARRRRSRRVQHRPALRRRQAEAVAGRLPDAARRDEAGRDEVEIWGQVRPASGRRGPVVAIVRGIARCVSAAR